ncbi:MULTISPECIES: DUF5908 family protein [Pseudoalteromonas]|uniref:DUF5908 family protein n=1 Tax=Pseudoalteromonas TaxID=53246 RepID=UPI00147CD38A|nr:MULTISPECIES: DUF5908 family protein [Pseudoalteromonas]MCF6437564.1 DUF5908 family protein [Pseudoalteromonas sp. MMG022]
MAVEIRELVIKTAIQSHQETPGHELTEQQVQQLKQQIVQECVKQLGLKQRQKIFER